jgi:hypothetical protein
MGKDSSSEGSPAPFPTTGWTCIQVLQDPEHPEHRAAKTRFAQTYARPVYWFLRMKRFPHDRADELTWDFLARFLEKDWADKADPQRGRFRNFLLKILTRYVADNEDPKRMPRQKAFERTIGSLPTANDEEGRTFEPAAGETPESRFWKEVRDQLVRDVLQNLEQHLAAENKERWFEVFRAARYQDQSADRPTQQGLAEQFALSRDQVRYILEQVDKRFRRLLRAELRDQASSEEEVDEEFNQLFD